ncbi:MAG: Hexaprenyldihydroxybenzoate methyltransferase, mitochondrial, variant 3 [Marteilia pararefringens]
MNSGRILKLLRLLRSRQIYRNYSPTIEAHLTVWSRKFSVDSEELKFFSRSENVERDLPLVAMNEIRVPEIRNIAKKVVASGKKEEDVKILDYGCGTGILTECIANIGSWDVTGIDASKERIEYAKARQSSDLSTRVSAMKYFTGSSESLKQPKFDIIVLSEVLEHIEDKLTTLSQLVDNLMTNGFLFVTTINKTCMSRILAIYGAEYILNLVPKQTHRFDKFLSPNDLDHMCLKCN